MRWISKRKPKAKIGDKRIRRRFAYLPVRCNEDWVIWLEHYACTEEFQSWETLDGPESGNVISVCGWRVVQRDML